MNSSVIGTIELADQSIETLAPSSTEALPARIRRAFCKNEHHAELCVVAEEVIEADLALISSQLRRELADIMREIHRPEARSIRHAS
jgi:hypothetical protein